MNNKAILLSLGIMLLALATFIQAYFILQESRAIITNEGVLGTHAANLLQLEQTNQRVQLYLDEAVSLAADQALQNIVTLSGVKDVRCGTYADVPYWRGPAHDQTIHACGPEPLAALRTSLQKIFITYLTYPQEDYLLVLPRSYDFFVKSTDPLTIIGTPLEPLTIRKAHDKGSDKLVSYPSVRVMKPNVLADINDLVIEADGILQRCQGYDGIVDECVTAYEQESKTLAEKHGSTYTPLTMGRLCTLKDQSFDRSVVLCKPLSAGTLNFALYIPTNIPLEINRFTLRTPSTTSMDWMNQGQNIIVNNKENIILTADVTTSDPTATRVEFCKRTCILLYQQGASAVGKGTVDRHQLHVEYTAPLEAGEYQLSLSHLVNGKADEEVHTPKNTVAVITP